MTKTMWLFLAWLAVAGGVVMVLGLRINNQSIMIAGIAASSAVWVVGAGYIQFWCLRVVYRWVMRERRKMGL